MAHRALPDLTPQAVVDLQDALLANADSLLMAALTILDSGNTALARSLAILALEESGKAIAVHERRTEMPHLPEGSSFRCEELDALWASHSLKLRKVHQFLVEERYWFGTSASDPESNAEILGSVRRWSERHDRFKMRGFYVDLSRGGHVLCPSDVADEDQLREVIERVHQIGWQIRLGEHIEGKAQDHKANGVAPAPAEDIAHYRDLADNAASPELALLWTQLADSAADGISGEALKNSSYRFNPPGADRSPFRNLGRVGHEAETREVQQLARDLGVGSATADPEASDG